MAVPQQSTNKKKGWPALTTRDLRYKCVHSENPIDKRSTKPQKVRLVTRTACQGSGGILNFARHLFLLGRCAGAKTTVSGAHSQGKCGVREIEGGTIESKMVASY